MAMPDSEWEKIFSFSLSCPVGCAYMACVDALAGMPNMSVRYTDEATRTIEASISVTLWSRGEDIRVSLTPEGDSETRIDVSTDTRQQPLAPAKDRRNYDDLECAVRYQLNRMTR